MKTTNRPPKRCCHPTVTALPDEKLTEFALRLVLTGHTDTPRENDFDFLVKADAVFIPPQPKMKDTAKKSESEPVKSEAKSKSKKETPPGKKLAA